MNLLIPVLGYIDPGTGSFLLQLLIGGLLGGLATIKLWWARVKMLVLAGSLMGGEITKAVEEVRAHGLNVISLNMAGSVPEAADLVVSDPIQAGVMAVMAVADTAKFDLMRQLKRRY